MKRLAALSLITASMLLPSHLGAATGGALQEGHVELGRLLPLWSVLPFLGILLSIALFPLFAPHFWHQHYPKVSAAWALIFALPFIAAYRSAAVHEILHIYFKDYIPFIILLWSLYTVAGGILVEGTLKGTPGVNTIFLLIGTLLASWVGTTGASMLLIRPVLRLNAFRQNKAHVVVFFTFLVSNIGGLLTPLGDPPLFLGFLHGVPFFWTFKLVPELALVGGLVLLIFFAFDTLVYRREMLLQKKGQRILYTVPAYANPAPFERQEPFRVRGLYNLIFLGGVVGGVLFSGLVRLGQFEFLGIGMELQNLIRDVILLVMGLLSFRLTPKPIRQGNEFTWAPIREVAYLFAGIFMCIIPALAMLRAGEEGALGVMIRAAKEPWHYFWMTGGVSSFLDNAPTYLTFLNTALGKFFPGLPEHQSVHRLIAENAIYLKAISAGAVFMGANTYIGNAPNFMVKSIAEERGVQMPSFFGYTGYSLAILIPVFVIVTFVFF